MVEKVQIAKVEIFILIQQIILSYYYDPRPTMDEGRDISKIRFGALEDRYDHFWPCQIFILIFYPEK